MRIALALLAWACLAAAAPGDDFRDGEAAYRAGDFGVAMPLLRRAADAGHAPAQALYGHLLDVAEFNEEAARYYRRAAEQGDADGQYGLATLHAAGEGVARDPAAARGWFERAAAQGHADAIRALAVAFLGQELGFSREPPDPAGIAWARLAAERDHAASLDYLARSYRSGAFGAIDLAQAERLEARLRALAAESTRKAGKRQ